MEGLVRQRRRFVWPLTLCRKQRWQRDIHKQQQQTRFLYFFFFSESQHSNRPYARIELSRALPESRSSTLYYDLFVHGSAALRWAINSILILMLIHLCFRNLSEKLNEPPMYGGYGHMNWLQAACNTPCHTGINPATHCCAHTIIPLQPRFNRYK